MAVPSKTDRAEVEATPAPPDDDRPEAVKPKGTSTLARLQLIAQQPAALVASIVFLAFVVAAIFAGPVTPYEPLQIVSPPLQAPSAEHWLGTDEVGRDLFTRLVYGGRTSIMIGLAAAFLALVVGVPWGLVSGYYRGAVDTVSMRVTDGLLAFPGIILAMATVAVLGANATNVMIAIGIIQIPRFTRLVRAEALALREREFVSAAIVSGASDLYILRRALLPNVTSTVIVQFTLTFALAVLTEAGLSFIGLGVQPPHPTWGGMLNAAKNFTSTRLSYAVLAGSAIFVLVLCLSLIGDALRDVLDPDRVARSGADGSKTDTGELAGA